MSRRRCNQCDRYRPADETALIGRTSGGSYRRAATSKLTGICDDCVRDFYRRLGPRPPHAVGRIDRWSGIDIIHRAVEIGEPHCTVQLRRGGGLWSTGSGDPILCRHYSETGDCEGVHDK